MPLNKIPGLGQILLSISTPNLHGMSKARRRFKVPVGLHNSWTIISESPGIVANAELLSQKQKVVRLSCVKEVWTANTVWESAKPGLRVGLVSGGWKRNVSTVQSAIIAGAVSKPSASFQRVIFARKS